MFESPDTTVAIVATVPLPTRNHSVANTWYESVPLHLLATPKQNGRS